MSELPSLRDYGRSLAVLMGTWDYAFLDRVPAAGHSLRRMERLLAGPLCGWPQDRLLVLPNEPSPGDLPDRLITAFDAVSDVALFYFVGHGQIAPDDQLCLGLVQSRPESNRRAATSLRFADVRQALQESSAAVKIVILDCCFAGLATRGTLAGLANDVLGLTAGTGAYTMAATSAYTTAWYQDEPGLAEPQTYFTKYLADLVEMGIPGQPSRLRLDPLFKQLRDNLGAARRPVPHSRAIDDAREFVFAYNAAPPETQRDPELELARLGQQLESLKAAADAQVSGLRAEAAERERELARLKEMLASTGSRDVGQQREIQDAIDQAARQLDDARAAQAALTKPRSVRSTSGNSQGFSRSGRAPQQSEQASGTPPARPVAWRDPPAATTTPSSGSRPAAGKARPAGTVPQPARTASKSGGLARETPPSAADAHEAISTADISTVDDSVRSTRSQRRRFLTIAMACAILVAAIAIPLALAMPGVPRSPSSSHTADSPARTPSSGPLTSAHPATLTEPASRGVASVAFGPGGTTLATGDHNGSTYLRKTKTGKVTATLTDPSSKGVEAVVFEPGSTTLATADLNGSTYLWNTTTGKVTATLTDPSSKGVEAVAFRPGGTILATSDANGSTYLWNTTTGKVTATLTDPSSKGVEAVAFEPGSTTLAAGDHNGSTYLWNTTTGKVTATLTDPSSKGVTSVAFEPSGTTLATGDWNGRSYLWNTATGKVAATLIAPIAAVTLSQCVQFIAFGPDGASLATADLNGSTFLWNTTTRRVTATLTDPSGGSVWAVAFGPDGTTLATGNMNGSAYLWHLTKHNQ